MYNLKHVERNVLMMLYAHVSLWRIPFFAQYIWRITPNGNTVNLELKVTITLKNFLVKKIEEAKVISLINCRVVGTAGAEGACATPITFSRVNVPFFLFLGPPQTSFNGFTAPPTVLPYFHFVKIINALYGLCPSKMAKNLLRIIWNHSKEMPIETFMRAKRWLMWLTPQGLQNYSVSVNSI